MTLSTAAQEKLQSLVQLLEKWLKYCSPTILESYPHLANSKEVLERSLAIITTQLQQGEQDMALMEDHGPLYLQWDENTIDLFSSPLLLKCWCGFPIKGFDETKVEKKAVFSFEGKEVEGLMENIQAWGDEGKDNHRCIRYKCTAAFPSDFRAGTIVVKVQISYDGRLEDQIEKTLELGGITTEGQAVLNFLKDFTIPKNLGEDPWNYVSNNSSTIEQAQTMSQLLSIQQKLQELLSARAAMQQACENFAYTEVLKGFIYNRTYELTAQKHFGGYWEETLPSGSSSREKLNYLDHWKIYSETLGKELVTKLQNSLDGINKKIEAIKAERALAEQNYTTAKKELQAKSVAGAELLDHIYTITQLDKQFEELKANYPILVGTEATDAHKLILQPQKDIQEIQKELQAIKMAYQTASEKLKESYLKVYKNTKGKLIDKALAGEAKTLDKKAKKEKKELPMLSLSILGQDKPLPLHAFIFDATTAFVDQANAFYELHKGEFSTIYRDVLVIDASQPELSIKAYDPLYRDITGEDEEDIDTKDETTYQHETSSRLVDSKGINPEDVDQGGLGDCYFLAGVASLAASDPEKIYGREDSIIQGPNSDGTYTVRLFIPDAEGQPKRVSIVVEPTFVTESFTKGNTTKLTGPEKTKVFAQSSNKNEMWVQLLEKAMAQLEGSYKEIEGKEVEMQYHGIQYLTGQEVEDLKFEEIEVEVEGKEKVKQKNVQPVVDELVELYKAKNKIPMAQFGTLEDLTAKTEEQEEEDQKHKKPASGENYILYRKNTRLYANHSYPLKDIKFDKEKEKVEEFILTNPHNDSAIKGGVEISITLEELKKYFDSITITK